MQLKKIKAIQIKLMFLLLLTTTVLNLNSLAQQQSLKYSPREFAKWNMFGPIRIHIQDFAVTEKYSDTASAKMNDHFLDQANLNYGIGFYQNFSRKLAMSGELMFGYGYMSKKSATSEDNARAWSQTIRTDIYYHFYNKVMQLEPYLFAGLHGLYKMGNIYVSAPIGVGVRYMFFNNSTLITAQVGYGIGLTNGIRNSVIYSTGFYINMKKLKQ